MKSTTNCLISSESKSTSSMNFCDTPESARSGQGWNQSMTVELIMARKRCARTRNCSPTGEHVNTMCRLVRDLLMKKSQQFSRVSSRPAPFTSPRMALMISSLSSMGNRSGTSPDASRSLMNTRNFSSVICESVNSHMTPSPLSPERLNIFCKSSFSELVLYDPEMTIIVVAMEQVCAASLESDCFPEPPTPTSRAWPPGLEMMREMRQMCLRASSNSTRSITALVSLYSASASSRILARLSNDVTSL
mmetsp:Transcript_47093/g.87783  ORF Transcript_47093/g.87783 Transcript_47093/m.87783 type:complete len:248 (-) Transcript_47093:2544-3287(-)